MKIMNTGEGIPLTMDGRRIGTAICLGAKDGLIEFDIFVTDPDVKDFIISPQLSYLSVSAG